MRCTGPIGDAPRWRGSRCRELRDIVTTYDAAYIALAEALRCPLVTADRRLAAAPGPRCAVETLGVQPNR